MTEPTMEIMNSWDDSFGMKAERLFAEVWARDILSVRDRRLLLLALLVGLGGLDDQVEVQLDAALRARELSADELREVVAFLTHYAGWARGSHLGSQVEDLIERLSRD